MAINPFVIPSLNLNYIDRLIYLLLPALSFILFFCSSECNLSFQDFNQPRNSLQFHVVLVCLWKRPPINLIPLQKRRTCTSCSSHIGNVEYLLLRANISFVSHCELLNKESIQGKVLNYIRLFLGLCEFLLWGHINCMDYKTVFGTKLDSYIGLVKCEIGKKNPTQLKGLDKITHRDKSNDIAYNFKV